MLFWKVVGWGVARQARLCCTGREWEKPYWEEEKEEVSGRDRERDLKLDSVKNGNNCFLIFLR